MIRACPRLRGRGGRQPRSRHPQLLLTSARNAHAVAGYPLLSLTPGEPRGSCTTKKDDVMNTSRIKYLHRVAVPPLDKSGHRDHELELAATHPDLVSIRDKLYQANFQYQSWKKSYSTIIPLIRPSTSGAEKLSVSAANQRGNKY